MDTPPVVAIISAGAMGAGIASRLTSAGCRVLTTLEGRTESTHRRAKEAGMEDVPLEIIIREAQWILSILPPISAEPFAYEVIEAARKAVQESYPVFVDCNEKNPETARRLASLFKSSPMTFIDASIVGLPPKENHDPAIYASADEEDQKTLLDFSELTSMGMNIKLLTGEGTGVGDASALKMSFSGIMKGMVGLYEIMLLSAYAHSPGTATALLQEMRSSLPLDLQRVAFYIPNSFTKAYRFVREMEEMKGFVRQNVDNQGHVAQTDEERSDGGGIAQIYDGFASIYQRIAESVEGHGNLHDSGLNDIEVLRNLVDDARLARIP